MRVLLSAALAACLMTFATPAGASDPSFLAPPKATDGVPWNRTGAYVGLTAGLGVAALQAEDFKFADQSYLGGIFAGFNVRLGDAVVGLEADYLLTDIQGSTTDGVVVVTAKTKYLASVRGRVGMPIGPALLYATAGPAFTEHKVAVAGPVESFSSELLVGGVFGGGIEASLTKTLFVRLEGLHYIFPDKDVACGPSCFFESKDQQTTVRVGLGFKLN